MKAYLAKEEGGVLLKRAARAAGDLYAELKVSYPGVRARATFCTVLKPDRLINYVVSTRSPISPAKSYNLSISCRSTMTSVFVRMAEATEQMRCLVEPHIH